MSSNLEDNIEDNIAVHDVPTDPMDAIFVTASPREACVIVNGSRRRWTAAAARAESPRIRRG